jgi:hypothetical protein
MTELDPRALEVAARALVSINNGDPEQIVYRQVGPDDFQPLGKAWELLQPKARAAVTAYFQSAPPEIRIGQFVIRHAPKGIWIGRTDGEGGEFAAADVERALLDFYMANF